MGKNKKKQNVNFYGGNKKDKKKYNKKDIREIADNLEMFYDITTEIMIVSGRKKKIKNALKTVKKGIHELRHGDPDKVLDYDAYVEYFGSKFKGW